MEAGFVLVPTGHDLRRHSRTICAVSSASTKSDDLRKLATSVSADRGKGMSTETKAKLVSIIEDLEAEEDSAKAGINSINALWRLLVTSRPGTSSPIQRLVTGSGTKDIYQKIVLGQDGRGKFSNIVDWRNTPAGGYLSVEASILSVEDNRRLKIRFDNAFFSLFDGSLRVPYPVPFRLLGKKAEGWLDITYLDEKLRISRGNRGSLFVLEKVDSEEFADVFS